MSSPIEMLKRKSSTFARPIVSIVANDRGFGQKLYDPNAATTADQAKNVARIVGAIIGDQFNLSLISDTKKAMAGDKDSTISALHLFGDLSGFTFSKGTPGGEAVGEMYRAKSTHEFNLQQEMPDIKKQIANGDVQSAVKRMTELGVDPKLQEYYVRTTINPQSRLSAGQLKKFLQYATPEERARMQRNLSSGADASQ